ncbi:MAG: hypothetical protein Q7R91_00840 [bacterium]|nr:hypothetical protein [bacterium]
MEFIEKQVTNIRTRFNNFSIVERQLFMGVFFLMCLWLFLTLYFLNDNQADFLSEYQVDKIVHFSGGIFAAMLLFLFLGWGKAEKTRYLYAALIIGVLWEIFEIIFLPDQLKRYRYAFNWWFADTSLDVVADVLGAYFGVSLLLNAQLVEK